MYVSNKQGEQTMLDHLDLNVDFEKIGYKNADEALHIYFFGELAAQAELLVKLQKLKQINVGDDAYIQAIVLYHYSPSFYAREYERRIQSKINADFFLAETGRKAAAFSAMTKRLYSSVVLHGLLKIRDSGVDMPPDFARQFAKVYWGRGLRQNVLKKVFGDKNRSCGDRRNDTVLSELVNDPRCKNMISETKAELESAEKFMSNIRINHKAVN